MQLKWFASDFTDSKLRILLIYIMLFMNKNHSNLKQWWSDENLSGKMLSVTLSGFSSCVWRERRRTTRNTFSITWAHTKYSADTKESNVYEWYGIPTHNAHLRSYPHSHFFSLFLQNSILVCLKYLRAKIQSNRSIPISIQVFSPMDISFNNTKDPNNYY